MLHEDSKKRREYEKLHARLMRKEHPERAREAVRKWRKNNPEKVLAWRLKNREKIRQQNHNYELGNAGKRLERSRRYHRENPLKDREWGLKRRYGLTLKEFNKKAEAQDFKCAICRKKKPLHVDHNYTTNKLRGLLCGNCNRGIGLLGDDPFLCHKANKYLLKYLEG